MDLIKEENLHLKLELEHRMNILRQENEIQKKLTALTADQETKIKTINEKI